MKTNKYQTQYDYEFRSIQSQRDDQWIPMMTTMRRTIEESILLRDIQHTVDFSQQYQDNEELESITNQDIDVLKLYIASNFSVCTDLAEREGLPKEIAQETKQLFFYAMVPCHSLPALVNCNLHYLTLLINQLKRHDTSTYSYPVRMAITYMYSHRYQCISGSQLAQHIQIDRTYLSRLFKQETSSTMMHYFKCIKMELAAHLIQLQLYPLSAISEMLGYSDYSVFCRNYKSVYGDAPGSSSSKHTG